MSDSPVTGGSKELPRGCYVVLHVGRGPSSYQEANDGLIVQDGERFQLRDNVWIERLDKSTAKNIQQACEPAHYRINRDIWDRQIGRAHV